MQVCTLLQTDNHASTSPLRFLQAGCPSCRPTNSVKALKSLLLVIIIPNINMFKCSLKGKGSQYSITERRVPELMPLLGSQPAGDLTHKPGGRLPLLSTRPAVTLATNFAAW